MKTKRFIFIIGITFLLLLTTSCGVISDSLCNVEDVTTLPSPDKNTKVVVRVRNCGATADYVTEVSILPFSRKNVAGYGNTFRIEGYFDVPDELEIVWQSDNMLSISYPESWTVYKSENRVRRITVEYQERRISP